MAILDQYRRYLDHFGTTVPVRELHADTETRGLCALRHDVDYDLDVALEMAYWEHEAGARATYYLLPTAAYWTDERLAEKCLQLQDYGHEVGLHVNAMAQWAGGETDDPERTLMDQLDTLRQAGVTVTGMAAHGDRRCYEHNISNYWCFRELRPQNPVAEEDGRTAEGPYDPGENGRRLQYPQRHVALRPDGCRYDLWSISMDTLGIEYDAWHTKFDRYFSDSGGKWTRTSDPANSDLGNERWQVLVHPIHWWAPDRLYFFLSTARCGSRWVCELLNTATPITARHEYILNQEFFHGREAEKATSNFGQLDNDRNYVDSRLADAWDEIESYGFDYAEVNVYLEHYIDRLQKWFPHARYVHLSREPTLVIRSLIERGWYDTPEDTRHPPVNPKNTDAQRDQFYRVCEYLYYANQRLMRGCSFQLQLESITSDTGTLVDAFRAIGIPVHPRLARKVINNKVNATESWASAAPSEWSERMQHKYNTLLGGVAEASGYTQFPDRLHRHNVVLASLRTASTSLLTATKFLRRELINRSRNLIENLSLKQRRVFCKNVEIKTAGKGVSIHHRSDLGHGYIVFGGSTWRGFRRFIKFGVSGWKADGASYLSGRVSTRRLHGGRVSVFALSYRPDGVLCHKRKLGALTVDASDLDFAFTPYPAASRFDVVLYIPKQDSPVDFDVECFSMERRRMVGDYLSAATRKK